MADSVTDQQIEINVKAYEQVMGKCFEAANRIAIKEKLGGDEHRKQIALGMFERFYSDQLELTKNQQLGDAMRGVINQVLEMRRM